MLTMRRPSAFTLGELGAVLAATGIVAALAYSTYQTYTVRNEVNEGIALASDLIPTVTEFFRRNGEVPAMLAAPLADADPAPQESPFVESVTVVDGRIDVRYGGQADRAIAGRRISLTPYETVDRHVVWICGNEIPGPGLEPLGFADGGRQAVQIPTTIEARYLSGPCR